jgi:asparagine synthase (glutamine-hydrolysing)
MFTNPYLYGRALNHSTGTNDRLSRFLSNSSLSVIKYPRFIAATNRSAASNGILHASIAGFPKWRTPSIQLVSDEKGDAHALICAFQEYGTGLFEMISGQFVFSIFDERNNSTIISLDKIGLENIYYTLSDSGLAFSTRLASLVEFSDKRYAIDNQAIYNYFYFHSTPSPGSIFCGINKLMGGQYLTYKNGNLNIRTYWTPTFSESSTTSISDFSEEMLTIIQRSVEACSDEPAIGAFLSGGLDSSSVTGMLAKIRPGGAKTFSIGFNAEGYDEMEYARIAAKHFGTQQHEYYVTPEDVLDMVGNIAAAYDEPFGNSSALPAYFCAKMAKENGINRLLAGDGGDEIFAGNERYVKQGVFELYGKVPSLLRTLVLEPLLLHNPLAKFIPVAKKASSYIAQAKIPLPDRLETYNYLHQHSADEIFENDFLSEIDRDEPLRLLRQTYHSVENATPVNKMMVLDWKRTLHDNDLVKVNRMCELAGVDVAYPLLSDELIEFSCRVPSNLKLKDGQLRWFYKEATKGFLPNEIIHKSKHGFGLPFGVWTSTHQGLKDFSYNALYALKKRGIFRADFIDNTIRMHKSVHAKYYGELVWVLMMLELWLASHQV